MVDFPLFYKGFPRLTPEHVRSHRILASCIDSFVETFPLCALLPGDSRQLVLC